MKVELDVVEFLELITYNQLFHYVTIPRSIGEALEASISKYHNDMAKEGVIIDFIPPFFIEGLGVGDYCIVWYPMQAWIEECKRRKKENDLYDAGIPRIKKAGVAGITITKLNADLIIAITSGQTDRAAEILKQIEALQHGTAQ